MATKVRGRTMPGENGRGLPEARARLDRGLAVAARFRLCRPLPDPPLGRRDADRGDERALHDVVRAGKVRYIGASSMYAWQFAPLAMCCPDHSVSMQNHYNLIYREEEREMIPQCVDMGVGVLPWSPLARGLLAGSRTLREQLTTRSSDRSVPRLSLPAGPRRPGHRPRRRNRGRAWRPGCPGRARLASAQARRHSTDRGSNEVEHVEDALAAEALVD